MVTEDDEDVDLELNLDQYNFHSEERRKGHRMSFEDEEEEGCLLKMLILKLLQYVAKRNVVRIIVKRNGWVK